MSKNVREGRWWEFYLVRYALGTVVGAICVYYLLQGMGDGVLGKWLMMPKYNENQVTGLLQSCVDQQSQSCLIQAQMFQSMYGFNLAQLVLLGIYGLAFNYIASAPILVIHATRSIWISSGDRSSWGWVVLYILGITISLGLISLFMELKLNPLPIFSVWMVMTAFVGIQVGMLSFFLFNKDCSFRANIYKTLHSMRESGRISADSYKHLREHGNAFLIVIFNFLLFYILSNGQLFNASNKFFDIGWAVGLLVIWLVPASFVYIVGQVLENDFRKEFGSTSWPVNCLHKKK